MEHLSGMTNSHLYEVWDRRDQMVLKDRTSKSKPLFQTNTLELLAQAMSDVLKVAYLTVAYRFAPVRMLPYSALLGSQAGVLLLGRIVGSGLRVRILYARDYLSAKRRYFSLRVLIFILPGAHPYRVST